MDFTALTAVADSTTIIAAITAMAAIKFGPRFVRWGYNQAIGFFR